MIELPRVVERACTDAGASRTRQLRWVAGELERGHATGTLPDPATVLTDPAAAARYLAAAQDGTLRSRASRRSASGEASLRVRITCLRILSEAVGFPSPAPVLPPAPAREPTPSTSQLAALRGWLERQATGPLRPRRVRDAAALAVAIDAPVRTGALATVRLADLDLAAATVIVDEAPPGARRSYHPGRHPLAAATVAALRRWLEVRDTVVAPRVDALWVSVAGNHRGDGIRVPAGLPLRARGLTRSVAAALSEANAALVGTPGWTPLPGRLGGLRSHTRDPEAGQDPQHAREETET